MAVEKELIQGINLMLEGKEEGFSILYSQTYNYVYARAKYVMKNEQDALDLTQETYIQAYKGIHSLKDVNNIYAWLGMIVYNQGMKIYGKREGEVLVNEEAESLFEDVINEDQDLLPEESAEAKATSNIIMEMINELPELQRAAIMAFYYDNMKIDEIAEAFDCSANTIKSRLSYAKKFLRDKVEEHERVNQYKLHSLSPAIIVFAFKTLLSGEGYALSATAAQNVYGGACAMVGVAPAAIAAGEASVGIAAGVAVEGAVGTTATAATTTTTAATAAVAKVGMALGTKVAIGLAAVVTTGAVAVAAGNAFTEAPADTQQETQTESQEEIPAFRPAVPIASFRMSTSMTDGSGSEPAGLITGQSVTWIGEVTEWQKMYGVYGISDDEYYEKYGGVRIKVHGVFAPTETEEGMINLQMEQRLIEEEGVYTTELVGEDVIVKDRVATFVAEDNHGHTWHVTIQFTDEGGTIVNSYYEANGMTGKNPEWKLYRLPG